MILETEISILVISNHNSFRVLFDKIDKNLNTSQLNYRTEPKTKSGKNLKWYR